MIDERREALEVQISDVREQLTVYDAELTELNTRRARALEFLRESESLAKYKELSKDLAAVQSEINSLELRREAASRLTELRQQQRDLTVEYGHLQTEVEREIDQVSKDEGSRFANLRRYFTEIIHSVLGQDAILAMRLNAQGGLDFTAEFLGETGVATSGDRGTSYRKLMCIAFDLALLRAHLDVPFARFVYHDGALEQLEPRKRQNLIGVFRQYSALGLQLIISALDSDLPEPIGSTAAAIQSSEVVLTLHDEGESGRLFKMPSW